MTTTASAGFDTWLSRGHIRPMRIFQPSLTDGLPVPAAAYLRHAIAPGTRLPSRVRLRMHGQIKLGKWLPFEAEQTIDAERGFWWEARMAGGLISGHDMLDRGRAETRFRACGIVPLARASGPDVARSAFGRVLGEHAAWMPGNLIPDTGTRWYASSPRQAVALVPAHGTYSRLAVGVDDDGTLREVSLARWGNPSGRAFGWVPFGMRAEAESTFHGFTVTSQGRAGWWYGTYKWSKGEFFRFTIDDLCPF